MKFDSTEKKVVMFSCFTGGILLLCLCGFFIMGISFYIIQRNMVGDYDFLFNTPTPTPELYRYDQTPEPNSEQPSSIELLDLETFSTLENITIPIANPADIAKRFHGVENIPIHVIDNDAPYELGDEKTFWLSNTESDLPFRETTTLQYITNHSYFWIGKDVDFDYEELKELADTFENQIYPLNRSYFGSEWNPGIDNDPHIFILYVKGIGINTAGYFSSVDSLHPSLNEYSNGHETFFFNADNSLLGDQYTYGVLSHEFQHMIHWHQDIDESLWMNEGFSELSILLNGYSPGGFDHDYIRSPDHQLNDWPNSDDTIKNYGASFLFLTYYWDRFGEILTKELAANPENGLKSIDSVLKMNNQYNTKTGEILTADDLVLDWAITNYINDPSVDDGIYYYHNYKDAITASATETIKGCGSYNNRMDVHQYGVDYIQIKCSQTISLQFLGSTYTSLLPESAHTGKYMFWSNKGDESDMTLTRKFDFTNSSDTLTLNYWTWFDIETDFDYLYLTTSIDGENWKILKTPSGTIKNPSGNNYGWGYTGNTDGWVEETIDLSQYAGEEVYLRFEYITDGATFGEGFLLDDISIPEIHYFEDFEESEGGWVTNGFARVRNDIYQSFRLAIIRFGDEISVEYLPLPENNILDIQLNLGEDDHDVVLVVVGTTRYTRQLATYEISLSP